METGGCIYNGGQWMELCLFLELGVGSFFSLGWGCRVVRLQGVVANYL